MSRAFSAPAFLLLLAGCGAPAPTERFANAMQYQVGKRADDPKALRNLYPDLRGSSRPLSNGNSEEEFLVRPHCAVWFEIDARSRTISKWRLDSKRNEDCDLPL